MAVSHGSEVWRPWCRGRTIDLRCILPIAINRRLEISLWTFSKGTLRLLIISAICISLLQYIPHFSFMTPLIDGILFTVFNGFIIASVLLIFGLEYSARSRIFDRLRLLLPKPAQS